jgi:serine/threonine protein kinase
MADAPVACLSSMSLTKLERIGKGSYGEVFKARLHDSGTIVVVKEVSLAGLSPEEEKEILNESQVMVQVEHKNVIRFMASFVENNTLHIVMEWAAGGDLSVLIKGHATSGRMIDEETLWTYLIQLTEGLQHLHSRRIMHRDIKV